jgi:hypothetical protein
MAIPPKPGVPAPSDLPPPGGSAPIRRDTVMNAPVQPAALGGPARMAPPSAPPRPGLQLDADDDAATMRMTVEQATGGPVVRAAQAEAAATSTLPASPGGGMPPMAPIAHWQAAAAPGRVPAGNTVPMPMVDLDDEPLVVPGRSSKVIAMVVTIVVGLTIGAAVVWFFLLG